VTLRIAGGVYENTDAAATATTTMNRAIDFDKDMARSLLFGRNDLF
jgi:hypothetical protein